MIHTQLGFRRILIRRVGGFVALLAISVASLVGVSSVLRNHEVAAASSCNTTGVTQNPDGSFSFASLRVANGTIVDPSGCVVKLVGFNYGWMDSDSVDIQSLADITSWKAMVPINVVRVAVNSYWYDNSYIPPNYPGQTVPQLLDQFIQEQKAAGNYVEIDIAEQFPETPCSKAGGSHCPPQVQDYTDWNSYVKGGGTGCPSKWPEGWIFGNSDPGAGAISSCPPAKEMDAYQPYALQALSTLAKEYANDSQVIFDAWNEPLGENLEGMSYSQFLEAMNMRISTIRTYANNLIDVFGNSIYQDMSQCAFKGTNLVIDLHTYNSNFNGDQVQNTFVPGFKACGQAFQINEYGAEQYSQTVARALTNLGVNDDVGSLYFDPYYLTHSPQGQDWLSWAVQCNTAIIGPLGYQPAPSTTTSNPSTTTPSTSTSSTSSTTTTIVPPTTSSTTTVPPTSTTTTIPRTTTTTTSCVAGCPTTTTTSCVAGCSTSTTTPSTTSTSTTTTTVPPTSTTVPPPPSGPGYWMLGSDGTVYNFGSAPDYESASPLSGSPGTFGAISASPNGDGYWLLNNGNSLYNVGYTPDLVAVPLTAISAISSPEVGVASTSDGQGIWVTTSSGQILTGGDAKYFGDLSGTRLDAPIVNLVPTPDSGGYWLLGGDGGVFTFGDAGFYGSTGGMRLDKPVDGIASTSDGRGYWLVASDGGVFTFGDASFLGSMGGQQLNAPVVGMVATSDGRGYWLVAADGGVFTFGDAGFVGSEGGRTLPAPIVAIAPA